MLRAVLLTSLLAPVAVHAAERVSQPGKYEGYARSVYSEWVRTSQYIAVRDGTRLAADIYRPALNGKPVQTPLPVIWQHTFNRTRSRAERSLLPDSVFAKVRQLTTYGYVIVEIDRRGMGSSFGARRGYIDRTEAHDAFDVTEWLAAQPWSDGKIGVYGCSNTGAAAMQIPTLMPPHLKAVFAGCYAWDTYDGFFRGGIFANWGSGPERTIEEDLQQNAPVDGDDDRTLLQQAVNEHRANTGIRTMWGGMPYRDSWSDLVNSRFWLETSVSTYRDQIERSGVAIYTQGGWYDDFRLGGLLAFANLSNRDKLVIGPWEHCRNNDFDLFAEYRRFFDAALKGVDNGVFDEAPIYYYTINANPGEEWRSAKHWPPAAKQTKYFLQSGGQGDNLSAAQPQARAGFDELAGFDEFKVRFDVSCPANWPMLSQTCVQDDKGVIYTSAPLTSDVEVTGHPVVSLWLASTVPDGNVFAYLEELAPGGQAKIVTDGRLKLSLRATNKAPYENFGLPWRRSLEEDAQPMPQGEAVELKFDMLPISYVFRSGHRIRLTLTGADPRERMRTVPETPPTWSIYADAQRPSAITLPIVTPGQGASRRDQLRETLAGRAEIAKPGITH